MAVELADLLTDLVAETREVSDLVTVLPEADWELPTPAPGWAIRDQISHLAFFDQAAVLAMTQPDQFRAEAAALLASGDDFPDRLALRYRSMPSTRLSTWFREARADLVQVADGRDPRDRTPWYGPDMSVASMLTARLMETWAHGQDIADALGAVREPTVRLRHIAHLGVSTFAFAHRLRDLDPPSTAVRIELTAPDGSGWDWGPPGAADRVTGPALDFCLVVTQRRHVADTDLDVAGPVATRWMTIAQAFAGAPGPGRRPGHPVSGRGAV